MTDKEIIKKRLKSYTLTNKKNKIELSYTKKVIKKHKQTNIIKGMGTSPGKIRGMVKLILGISDINKIKEGDVLVTKMTTPDIVPMMKKAKAIITDEGGLLCHAAIVSREMNIPCIVGTNIATEILKDGDLIELDANKGIARKIIKH